MATGKLSVPAYSGFDIFREAFRFQPSASLFQVLAFPEATIHAGGRCHLQSYSKIPAPASIRPQAGSSTETGTADPEQQVVAHDVHGMTKRRGACPQRILRGVSRDTVHVLLAPA